MTARSVYAHTNVELFDQLRHEGYSASELGTILYAYEFAVHMFTGRFQPSGNAFICHPVRMASILASLHAPSEVVAAALLHNVYGAGDFGDGRRDVSKPRRELVQRAVGAPVEEYTARYKSLRWNIATIPVLCDRLDALDATERHVVLMKLANELEHYLDLELLYYGGTETERAMRHGDVMMEIAERLGFPGLAADLGGAFQRARSGEIPAEIRKLTDRERPFAVIGVRRSHESMLILPRSCRKRPWVRFVQALHGLRAAMKVRRMR